MLCWKRADGSGRNGWRVRDGDGEGIVRRRARIAHDPRNGGEGGSNMRHADAVWAGPAASRRNRGDGRVGRGGTKD